MNGPHIILAQIHGANSRLAEALAEADEAIRLLPEQPNPFMFRGEILWVMGRREESAHATLRFAELNGWIALDRAHDIPALSQILASDGPEAFLRELTQRLEKLRANGRFVSAYELARLHAQLGHRTRALELLEEAVDEHRTLTLGVKNKPIFKDYQDEPRFHAVLRRLNLEK